MGDYASHVRLLAGWQVSYAGSADSSADSNAIPASHTSFAQSSSCDSASAAHGHEIQSGAVHDGLERCWTVVENGVVHYMRVYEGRVWKWTQNSRVPVKPKIPRTEHAFVRRKGKRSQQGNNAGGKPDWSWQELGPAGGGLPAEATQADSITVGSNTTFANKLSPSGNQGDSRVRLDPDPRFEGSSDEGDTDGESQAIDNASCTELRPTSILKQVAQWTPAGSARCTWKSVDGKGKQHIWRLMDNKLCKAKTGLFSGTVSWIKQPKPKDLQYSHRNRGQFRVDPGNGTISYVSHYEAPQEI